MQICKQSLVTLMPRENWYLFEFTIELIFDFFFQIKNEDYTQIPFFFAHQVKTKRAADLAQGDG